MKTYKIETNQEKASYHLAMAFMYENDISMISAFNEKNKFGGFTAVFNNVFPNSKMVEVAVSYCDYLDPFVEEVGATLALAKFEEGEVIQLPIGFADKELQAKIIYSMFSEIYKFKEL